MASKVRKEQQITLSDLLCDRPRHCIQKLKPVPALGQTKHSWNKTKLFVPQTKDRDVTKGKN